jgi:RNA polymerase sigma factor (sigma-70 family)
MMGMASEDKRSDGELLGEFVVRGSQSCFEALTARHGRMVLNVCLRMLGDRAAAEDATQAVFLTLAKKAGALRRRTCLGGWLYHVARHVSLHARRAATLRAEHEKEAVAMAGQTAADQAAWPAVREALDNELAALPERYRQAIVLFHLEQRSLGDTACLLDVPVGTASAWITRGRQKLRARLARRGVAVSAGGLAVLLSEQACEAALSAPLATSIGNSAAAVWAASTGGAAAAGGAVSSEVAGLMKGGLKMMFMAKVKAVAVATVGMAAAGTVAITAVQIQTTGDKAASGSLPGGGEAILRGDPIPISVRNTAGEIYVAVPEQHVDGANRQMWAFVAGMADSYRRILRLTEEEQAQVQSLLEETWIEADAIEKCFVVTQEGDSVTAELSGADAVRRLQDTELRLCSNFLRKVAGVLGPARSEIVNWFAARHRDVIPWPLSAGPDPGTTVYRMKLSRVSGVAGGGIRFEIDKEGRRDVESGHLGDGPDAGGASLKVRAGETGRAAFSSGSSSSVSISTSSAGGTATSRSRFGHVSSLTPWPALGARLGFSREAVLTEIRAGRARYADRRRSGQTADARYRTAGEPLVPPALGAVAAKEDRRYVFVAMDLASVSSPLQWLGRTAVQSPAGGRAEPAAAPYSINPAWLDVLRLNDEQAQRLAGALQATVLAMDRACAEGLSVTRKSDSEVACEVKGETFRRFGDILKEQDARLRTGRLTAEQADIVRAFAASTACVSSPPAWFLDHMRRSQQVGEDGVRIAMERRDAGQPNEYFQVQLASGRDGRAISTSIRRRNDLPPFLAALWPAVEPAGKTGAVSTENSAARGLLRQGLEALRAGQFDAAAARFQEALAGCGGDPDLESETLYWLGDCHARVGRTEAAQKTLKSLTAKYPGSKWARLARGRLGGNASQP